MGNWDSVLLMSLAHENAVMRIIVCVRAVAGAPRRLHLFGRRPRTRYIGAGSPVRQRPPSCGPSLSRRRLSPPALSSTTWSSRFLMSGFRRPSATNICRKSTLCSKKRTGYPLTPTLTWTSGHSTKIFTFLRFRFLTTSLITRGSVFPMNQAKTIFQTFGLFMPLTMKWPIRANGSLEPQVSLF